MQQIMKKITNLQLHDTYGAEVIYEENSEDENEEIHIADLDKVPPKMEDIKPKVHDPMEENNLGTQEEPRITYISSLLLTDLKKKFLHSSKNTKTVLHEIMMEYMD